MILRDPVHGLIRFTGDADALVMALLRCPEVQRLRRIRAVGLASLAFPGGEHSRFAHAVGSAHVMVRYLDHVRGLADQLPARDRIDRETAQVALAAALLHDLGHGPYSHTFETLFPQVRPHESWTSQIVLASDGAVHRVLREFGEAVPERVERLIHGYASVPHLARAVSGMFDVDRCDYLLRDSHMTGVSYVTLDLDWLLQSLRLYAPDDQTRARLAVDGEKGLTAVEGFFLARLHMYRQVYLHKAVRSAEQMFRALFRRLAELGPQPGTPLAVVRMLRGEPVTTGQYLDLDDVAIDAAIRSYVDSDDPVLSELAARIRNRDLYKTYRLRPDAPLEEAQVRLDALLAEEGIEPSYLGVVDRVQIEALVDDDAPVVVDGHGVRDLLDASPLLRGLANESFVSTRLVFPPSLRPKVIAAFEDMG